MKLWTCPGDAIQYYSWLSKKNEWGTLSVPLLVLELRHVQHKYKQMISIQNEFNNAKQTLFRLEARYLWISQNLVMSQFTALLKFSEN